MACKFDTFAKTLYFSVVSLALCIMLFGTKTYAGEKKVPSGITIGNIDAGGMTQEELVNTANEYVSSYTSQNIALDVDGNEVDVTAGELGYYWKNTDIVEKVMSYCHEGNVIERYKQEKDIQKEGITYEFEMDVNDEVMRNTLKSECSPYNVYHVDAKLTKNGENFDITPEKSGRIVDIDTGIGDLHDYLLNDWDGSEGSKKLKVVDDLPNSTAEDCAKVKDMIGTFSTSYSTSSGNYNRNKNLENGMNLLNGITIGVGETISVNSYLEPWTTSNGWYPGGTFVNGVVENTLGGGICQVSTTLYNAALNAELEIVERYCHSMTVSYVPVSMDAALAGTWKDLKIRNNTDTPVYIEGIFGAGRLTFNIYGVETRSANRTVQYSSERVGYTSGYKSRLVKRVYVDGALQSESVVNSSTYKNGGGSTGTRTALRNQQEAATAAAAVPQTPEETSSSEELSSSDITMQPSSAQNIATNPVQQATTAAQPTTGAQNTTRSVQQQTTPQTQKQTTPQTQKQTTPQTQKQTTASAKPTPSPTTTEPQTTTQQETTAVQQETTVAQE